MAGASDKARFYLEQSVPELREWERREIFSKEEISAIAAKRSDFEHILNARGSKPADYARYAEYEMNLDALRRKRVKRKGVKVTAHSGQRRIFFILDRATKKFHGDVGLWMQYIEYARKQKANKKLGKVLTDVLRMHPTKPELWIYAARYAMDVQADTGNARSYMQRGLRFCKNSRAMYIEYARLEMGYIAKISARRKILGIDSSQKRSSERREDSDLNKEQDMEADMILLPPLTAEDLPPDSTNTFPLNDGKMADLAQTPALSGAIPIAIFEAAMQQFDDDEALGELFFDTFLDFIGIPCTQNLLRTVVDRLSTADPTSLSTVSCRCRLNIVGVPPDSPDFPSAVGIMIKEVRFGLKHTDSSAKSALSEKLLSWLSPLANDEGLVPELKQVLSAVEKQLSKHVLDPKTQS